MNHNSWPLLWDYDVITKLLSHRGMTSSDDTEDKGRWIQDCDWLVVTPEEKNRKTKTYVAIILPNWCVGEGDIRPTWIQDKQTEQDLLLTPIGCIPNRKMRERLKENQKRQCSLVSQDLLEALSYPANRRGRWKKRKWAMNNRSTPHDGWNLRSSLKALKVRWNMWNRTEWTSSHLYGNVETWRNMDLWVNEGRRGCWITPSTLFCSPLYFLSILVFISRSLHPSSLLPFQKLRWTSRTTICFPEKVLICPYKCQWENMKAFVSKCQIISLINDTRVYFMFLIKYSI